MATPSSAAKRINPMLVGTFIALEVLVELLAEPVAEPVRSGTGDPTAVAPTPAITGPLSGV